MFNSVTGMFNQLFRSFREKNKNQPSLSSENDDLKILRYLKNNNCRLIINIANYRQTFQSAIITIDKLNDTLIVDELFPKPDFKIKEGESLYFEFHQNGELTSFKAAFISYTHTNGTPAISTNYPHHIKHEQRRDNFRLVLKTGQTPSAKLTPSYQPTLSGIVKDISSHGLRINIQGNEIDVLKKGDILKSCHINLDDNKTIECQLTIRSRHFHSRPYRHTQIGTEITDIQLSDRKRLNHYVNQQQRLQCKLRATDRL